MDLATQLRLELDELAGRQLQRRLRLLPPPAPVIELDGRRLLHAASNDYLGLAGHPALKAAAAAESGSGSGASRLISGHSAAHAAAEAALAAWKKSEAALILPTGFMANLAVLTTLAGPQDLIVQDKLNHASLVDAARYCGATVRTYPHLGLAKAGRLLADGASFRRRFLVTDSVFSMDGDVADLAGCAELCERHGATLVVDEAHGTGVFGPTGAGLIEADGLSAHPAVRAGVVVSTASKALGSLGGMVSGPKVVVEALVHLARPFIFTTAIAPAQAAAIAAAIGVAQAEPERRRRLAEIVAKVRAGLASAGWELPPTRVPTPIVPLVVGASAAAMELARALETRGVLALPVRYPAVPEGAARVRLALRADWNDAEVGELLAAIGKPPSTL